MMDYFCINDFKSSLPLLKKAERVKLRDLYDSIEQQGRPKRLAPQQKCAKTQGILWEWQADDGSWQSFEPEEQERIEHAAKTRQKTVPFLDSIHFMHTVDLICMQMINMKTGTAKDIRRTPPLHSFISGSSKQRSRFTDDEWNLSDDDDYDGYSQEDGFGGIERINRSKECFKNRWRARPRGGYSNDLSDDVNVLGTSGLLTQVTAPRVSEWSRHASSERRDVRSRAVGSTGAVGSTSRAVGSRNYVAAAKAPKKKSSSKGYQAPLMIGTKKRSSTTKEDAAGKMKKWLEKMKLEGYYEKFRRERITLKEVHALQEGDLEKLGFPMGARKRFLQRVKELETKQEPPNEYLCPITMMLMKEPVILSDGFTYERSAIENWLKDQNKSPMTNEKLDVKTLTPNRQLKKLIEDFKVCSIDH